MISPEKLCQKRGCECEATHLLQLRVPATDDSMTAEATLGVKVCEDHADEADAESWLAIPDIRAVLALSARGCTLDTRRAQIVGIPISSLEAQVVAAHKNRVN